MWNFQEVDRDGASTSESNAAARKSSQACSPLPPLSRSLPAAMTDAAPQAAVETTPQSTIVAKKFETESEHSVSAVPLSHLLGARKHGLFAAARVCLRSYLRSPTAWCASFRPTAWSASFRPRPAGRPLAWPST